MSIRVPTRPPAAPRHGGPPPPAPDEGGGGGGGGWAWLMTADGAIEAELVRGYLESAGVPVALDRRDPSPGAWLFLSGNVRAPVQVFVPASLLDTARLELLEAGFVATPESPQREVPDAREARAPRRYWFLVAAVIVIAAAVIVLLQALGSATCVLGMPC